MTSLFAVLFSCVAQAAPADGPPPIALRAKVVHHASVHLSSPLVGVAKVELSRLGRDLQPRLRDMDACLLARETAPEGRQLSIGFTVTPRRRVRDVVVEEGLDDGPIDACVAEVFASLQVTSVSPRTPLPVIAEVSLLTAHAAPPAPASGEAPPTTYERAVTAEAPMSSLGRQYHDEGWLFGVVSAPAAAEEGGLAPTAFLARFHLRRGKYGRSPLLWGLTSDVRGFRSLATHTQLVGGVHLLPRRAVRLALVSGIGASLRGVFPEAAIRFWVPVEGSVRWLERQGRAEVGLRGGVNVGYDAEGALAVEPSVILALTGALGEPDGVASVAGVRVEVGWRREWGASTVTLALGIAH